MIRSSVTKKQYELITDWMPEHWHERLKIALAHDTVNVVSNKYIGGIRKTGDYGIKWVDFLDYHLAPAETKVLVTPYLAANDNCRICSPVAQVNAVDDDYVGTMLEDTCYTIDVLINDEVCCAPITVTVTYTNAAYVVSATVQPDNSIEICIKAGAITRADVELIRYRVSCPNGDYDEASVRADVDGVEPTCAMPDTLITQNVDFDQFEFVFSGPSPAPGDGWSWQVTKTTDTATIIAQGALATDANPVLVDGLEPSTSYTICVKAMCAVGEDESEWKCVDVTTDAAPSGCGKYRVEYDNGSGLRDEYSDISYYNCLGVLQTIRIWNTQARVFCIQESAPGVPIYLTGETSYLYLEPC
jgi:hypothetical protein